MENSNRSIQIVVFLVITIFFSACSPKKSSEEIKKTDTIIPVSQASESVIGFLTWYKVHMMDLNAFKLVTNNGNATPQPDKPYSVNFSETEKYIAALKASGFISEKYVENTRAYFKKWNDTLKVEKQYDGPPMGFDADLIMLSQDFDLNFLDQVKINTHPGGTYNAHVMLEFPYGLKLAYAMSLENGKWLIDDIQNVSER